MAPDRAKRSLGDDCIDIWYCPLDAAAARSLPLTTLTGDEIARYRKFSSANAALQFLAGRIVTRAALSAYADVPEQAWRFQAGEHGRPFIAEPAIDRSLHFSLSHTACAVAVAVGRTPDLGLDIETVDRRVDVEAIGRVVFTTSEMTWIGAGQNGSAVDRFYDLWTMKEAYMKARGKGFALNPRSFAIADTNRMFRLVTSPVCETDPERWNFSLSSPRSDLRMALASGNEARIEMVTFGPL